MNGYYKINFISHQKELLLGLLMQFDFEAYAHMGDGIEAWLEKGRDHTLIETQIKE